MASGVYAEVLFVTLHATNAFGGPEAVKELAEHSTIPITVWNVDCLPIVYRVLPLHPVIRYIHATPADAALWKAWFPQVQYSGNTYGVGEHMDAPATLPTMEERNIPLLVPLNLSWCGHTLDSALRETRSYDPAHLAYFEKYFETFRDKPHVDIPAAVGADLSDDRDLWMKLSRVVVLATQLWRRNWLFETLMDYPVVLDSNIIPEKLQAKAARCTARILTDSDIGHTHKRILQSKAVLTCSSSHDLLHDRVGVTLSHGAIVLAEKNQIYPEVFPDDELLFYDFCENALEEAMEFLSKSNCELNTFQAVSRERYRDVRGLLKFEQLLATHEDNSSTPLATHQWNV